MYVFACYFLPRLCRFLSSNPAHLLFMFNFIDRCSFFFPTAGFFRINGENRLSCSQASFCAFSPLFVFCCSCLCRSSHFSCRKPVAQFSSFVFPILLTSYEFFSPFSIRHFYFSIQTTHQLFFFDRLCRLAYSSALLAVWKGRKRKKKERNRVFDFCVLLQFFFVVQFACGVFILLQGSSHLSTFFFLFFFSVLMFDTSMKLPLTGLCA